MLCPTHPWLVVFAEVEGQRFIGIPDPKHEILLVTHTLPPNYVHLEQVRWTSSVGSSSEHITCRVSFFKIHHGLLGVLELIQLNSYLCIIVIVKFHFSSPFFSIWIPSGKKKHNITLFWRVSDS